jgi:hypothetical protein
MTSKVVLCTTTCCAITLIAWAISRSTLDDFESAGSRDWTGGASEIYLETGGPTGADDAFLELKANGGVGQGSKLATFNTHSRWTGNYEIAGVNTIGAWIKNFSNQPLNMRVVLFATDNQRWTSKKALDLAPHQDWTYHEFKLDADSLVRVLGNQTHKQVIANVTKLMIRHDSEPPSSGGTSINAVIGLDNIQALRRPIKPSP